ncbi:MAG: hypothetical protein IPN08_16010 [Bacteroidales bacterium]|nr:hypothetical protein [Bacteroidales bacterium]
MKLHGRSVWQYMINLNPNKGIKNWSQKLVPWRLGGRENVATNPDCRQAGCQPAGWSTKPPNLTKISYLKLESCFSSPELPVN